MRRMRTRRALVIGLMSVTLAGCGKPSPGSAVLARGMCSSGDWRLLPPGSNGATGAVTGAAVIRLTGADACRLRTALTFSVQRQSGTTWITLRNLRGNPEHVRVNALLRHGDRPIRVWGWRSYCARQSGPFRFQVTASGQSAATRVTAPFCEALPTLSRLAASRRPWSAGGIGRLPDSPYDSATAASTAATHERRSAVITGAIHYEGGPPVTKGHQRAPGLVTVFRPSGEEVARQRVGTGQKFRFVVVPRRYVLTVGHRLVNHTPNHCPPVFIRARAHHVAHVALGIRCHEK
jgi:hypothetical protein